MSTPVVADADTLFAATTRGLLIYLDYHGPIKLHWSPLILDEVSRVLVDTGRKQTPKDAKAHEARMCDALPNALVSAIDVQVQFAAVASAVRSVKDTHVAACALTSILHCSIRLTGPRYINCFAPSNCGSHSISRSPMGWRYSVAESRICA